MAKACIKGVSSMMSKERHSGSHSLRSGIRCIGIPSLSTLFFMDGIILLFYFRRASWKENTQRHGFRSVLILISFPPYDATPRGQASPQKVLSIHFISEPERTSHPTLGPLRHLYALKRNVEPTTPRCPLGKNHPPLPTVECNLVPPLKSLIS